MGQKHPRDPMRFNTEKEALQVIKYMDYMSPRHKYIPSHNEKFDEWEIIRCDLDAFQYCYYNQPVTEEEAEKVNSTALSEYRRIQANPSKKSDKFDPDKSIEYMVNELTRPRYLPNVGWAQGMSEDPSLEWLRTKIGMDKMIQQMKGIKGMATFSEALYYMMPLTHEAPLDRDWTEIYLHLGRTVMEEHTGTKQTAFDSIGGEKLNDHQMRMLNDFRRWLWRKSVEHVKR